MVLKEIPTGDVVAGDNIRSDPASIASLVLSVRTLGILNPITVQELQNGKYKTVTGGRRLAAAQLAKLATIPAVVRTVDKNQRLLQQLVENIQREDLNPIDEAVALSRLLTMSGESQLYIARLLGKTGSWVSSTLAILRLSKEEKAAIRTMGKSPSKAVLTAATRIKDPDLRKNMVAGKLTRLEARKTAKRGPRKASGRPANFMVNIPTDKAIVIVRFHRPGATRAELVAALSEARTKVLSFGQWPPSHRVPIR